MVEAPDNMATVARERREYQRCYYQDNKEKWKEYGRRSRAQEGYRERKNVNAARYRKTRRDRVDEIKLASGCVDCGYNDNARALHFDHINGKKVAAVSMLVTNRVPWEVIEEEILKCEVRCANCHSIKTWRP